MENVSLTCWLANNYHVYVEISYWHMTTKEKILSSSIRLFNQHGLVNVRLQQIADEVGISVGNLAYHFHSKEAIIQKLVIQLSDILKPIFDEHKEFPGLLDFDAQLARYYHSLLQYSFFFTDLIELQRNYPKQIISRQTLTNKIIQQIHNWLSQSEANGILIKEFRPGHYNIIAQTIWMIITFYLIRPNDAKDAKDQERVFKEMVWSQVLPHFTENGRMEFDVLIESMLDSFVR